MGDASARMTAARRMAGVGAELMLRIRLPMEYHLRLHRLKLETGRNMGQAVRAALDLYLDTEEKRVLASMARPAGPLPPPQEPVAP